MPSLSLILPTRRCDAALIARTGINAERVVAKDVILVEPDERPAARRRPALPSGWRLLSARRGRGSQAALGVRAAVGDWLMILHDDTDLPAEARPAIEAAFADPSVGMTCFRLRFDRQHWLLGLYEAGSRIESALTTFGDQAMVVRRAVYERVGGLPDWPLFEDVELARRVRRHSRILKLPCAVTTSASRFAANGMLRQQLANGWLLGRFFLGASPERLACVYERQRGSDPAGGPP